MYSSEPKERLILWDTEPTSNPPSDHYFVWIKDGKFYTLDDQGIQKEYATIEELSAKVNTSDIVDNLTSEDTDKPLSANQGKVLQDGKEDADSTILKEGDVEDSLNSTSVTKPLSAKQGKNLQDNKEDADSTILKEGDVEDNLNSTSTNKPLSANQGKNLQDNKEPADSTILKEGDVEDSLNSTDTDKPLSANQGKLLNDDKASLSGANFTDMPQVDGIPIVERGSNSDGEFVRFADGTQICRRTASIDFGIGRERKFFSYPINFVGTPHGGWSARSSLASNFEIESWARLVVSTRGTEWVSRVSMKPDGVSEFTGTANAGFLAIGRWY